MLHFSLFFNLEFAIDMFVLIVMHIQACSMNNMLVNVALCISVFGRLMENEIENLNS